MNLIIKTARTNTFKNPEDLTLVSDAPTQERINCADTNQEWIQFKVTSLNTQIAIGLYCVINHWFFINSYPYNSHTVHTRTKFCMADTTFVLILKFIKEEFRQLFKFYSRYKRSSVVKLNALNMQFFIVNVFNTLQI